MAKRKGKRKLEKGEIAVDKSTNRPAAGRTNPSRLLSLIRSLKKVFSFLVIALVPLLAFLFQYFVSRPYIVVDKIEVKDRNPFKHEFIIKNSGMTKAYDLNIALVNPDILTDSGLHIGTYGDMSKDAAISELSGIEGVKIPPQQSFSFTPDNFIHFIGESKPREAVITLRFKYHDFLHIFEYEDRLSYRIFPEENYLIWKPVGPRHLSLDKRTG